MLERIEGVLARNWLTNHGPLVRELEARLSSVLDVEHTITTSSGTAGLQLAIQTLGLTGEVIVPSFTFIATAHALAASGVEPVFCDIDPRTHCVDPAAVERAITPRTTAILAVHLWGNAAPVVALEAIARRHGLRLLFDAAHALGSDAAGRPIGAFGQAEVFSLHATKIVNGFEGGFITTNDEGLADGLRRGGNFGFTGEDVVGAVGVNAKMSEASAAMALTSLEDIDLALRHNAANLEAYETLLGRLPGLDIAHVRTGERHNRQYVVAEVDEAAFGLSRDELVAALRLENVMARRYFHPGCHAQEPYRSRTPDAALDLPVTTSVSSRVVVLPTGRSVTEAQITRLVKRMAMMSDRSVDVRRALEQSHHPAVEQFRTTTAES